MKKLWVLFILLLAMSLLPVQAQNETTDCPDTLPSRLQAGGMAQNTPGEPSNLRLQPTVHSAKVGEIPPEAVFAVLDGPVCAEGYAWWQVDHAGMIGWTIEGTADDYWTIPLDASDGRIMPWNAQLLSPINAFRGEENTGYGLAINPTNTLVALGTGYPNNLIRIWDYAFGEVIAVLDPAYNNDARTLSFDTMGEWLAVGGMPGDSVQVWSVADEERVHQLEDSSAVVAFRPDFTQLAYLGFPYDIVFWDVAYEEEAARWPGAVRVLATDLVFNDDGSMLALVEHNGLVTVWDVDAGEEIASFDHVAAVTGAVFPPNAETLLTVHCREADPGSNVTCLHLKIIDWDIQTGQRRLVIDLTPGLDLDRTARLAVSPDGSLLALSEMARLWLFDLATGRQLSMVESISSRHVAFTYDQKFIIVSGSRAQVQVWGLEE